MTSGYLIGQDSSRRLGFLRRPRVAKARCFRTACLPLSCAHTNTHDTSQEVRGCGGLSKQSPLLKYSYLRSGRDATDHKRVWLLCRCSLGDKQGKTSGNCVPRKSEFSRHRLQNLGSHPGKPILLALLLLFGKKGIGLCLVTRR